MVKPLESIAIDFVILADYAEVLNGKLYMMGGGYDRKRVNDLAQPINLNMAIGVLVPWHMANERHAITLRVEDEDGSELSRVNGDFNVGRPPHSVRGQSFRVMVALNGRIKLPRLGTYRVVAAAGTDEKAVTFIAHDKQGNVTEIPQAS